MNTVTTITPGSRIDGCPHPKSDHRHGDRRGYRCCLLRPGGACGPCVRAHTRAVKQWRVNKERGISRRLTAVGTVRRVRAMYALGWTSVDIARAGGAPATTSSTYIKVARGRDKVDPHVAAVVRKAYRALATRKPPERDRLEKINRSRSRNWADREGWYSPAAWEDDIDDPAAKPHGTLETERARWRNGYDRDDPVMVERACDGDFPPELLSPKQRGQAVRLLASRRWSDAKIAERLGMSERNVVRIRTREGIKSCWTYEAA